MKSYRTILLLLLAVDLTYADDANFNELYVTIVAVGPLGAFLAGFTVFTFLFAFYKTCAALSRVKCRTSNADKLLITKRHGRRRDTEFEEEVYGLKIVNVASTSKLSDCNESKSYNSDSR